MRVYEDIYDYLTDLERSQEILDRRFCIMKISDYEGHQMKASDIRRFIKPHKRDFFEITIVDNDTVTVNIGDERLPESSNILDLVSPFQMYSIDYNSIMKKKDTDVRPEGYTMLFKSSFLLPSRQSYQLQQEFPFFRVHTKPRYQLTQDDMTELLGIFDNIYREIKKDGKDRIPVVQSYMNILLYKIKNITHSKLSTVALNRFEAITARFEQCIVSEEGRYLSVSEYADKLNISPVYLSECVKKTTGKSPREVISIHKLVHAKSLLQQADLPIADISEATGFSEVTNFTKFFKKNTGMTPIKFRKLQKP